MQREPAVCCAFTLLNFSNSSMITYRHRAWKVQACNSLQVPKSTSNIALFYLRTASCKRMFWMRVDLSWLVILHDCFSLPIYSYTFKSMELYLVMTYNWLKKNKKDPQCCLLKGFSLTRADSGGGAFGAIAPSKPTKVTLFTMILHNSENSIRDIRPFCRLLFCHSSVLK